MTIPGDAFPTGSEIIEVHVAELRQLFNPIDPAPLPDRELDPRIEVFIVDWSREVRRDVPLALRVRLGQRAIAPEEMALVHETVHRFFTARAASSRRRLRLLFQGGRTSLLIGLAVLTLFMVAAQLIASRATGGVGRIVYESLSIGGWVAMWRPLEIFLYDWWPIRADAQLFDRLAAMPVRVASGAQGPAAG
jgi:hypothetical protein